LVEPRKQRPARRAAIRVVDAAARGSSGTRFDVFSLCPDHFACSSNLEEAGIIAGKSESRSGAPSVHQCSLLLRDDSTNKARCSHPFDRASIIDRRLLLSDDLAVPSGARASAQGSAALDAPHGSSSGRGMHPRDAGKSRA
jgi:hypothetical protein